MVNNIILIGRLVADPELKVLDDGRKVADITLAVQRPFKNMDGQYDVDFIKIILWEGLALSIESYCKKGALIAVKARLQSWTYGVSGKKQNLLEVIGEKITFLQTANSKKDPNLDGE